LCQRGDFRPRQPLGLSGREGGDLAGRQPADPVLDSAPICVELSAPSWVALSAVTSVSNNR